MVEGFRMTAQRPLQLLADRPDHVVGTVEAPGRKVAAKAGLNRSILDAGWGQFISILVAKAEGAGRRAG